MKTPSTPFIIRFSFIIACILLPSIVVWCCGPVLMPDETRFTLFRQGLDENNGLTPFNYTELPFNSPGTDLTKEDYQRNCNEWKSFCGNSVKASDIYAIQYQVSADSFLLANQQQNLQQFKGNTFIKWLQQKNNKAAMDYMVLAKEAENTQYKNDTNPWDTSAVNTVAQCASIAVKANDGLNLPLPVFLKERYAFQAVKMNYYSGSKTLQKIYEDYLLKSNSIVAAWALVYYGMSQDNKNRQTALLLQAFDKTEEKKEFCYQHVSTSGLAALEKTTTDANLLVLINTLKALKNKGRALNQLKAVYLNNANSKYLPLLITREINKLENWLWSPEMLYFTDNYRAEAKDDNNATLSFKKKLTQKDRLYLDEATLFMEGIVGKNNSHASFLQLALIHLYNMQHNFVKAQTQLQKMGALSDTTKETQHLIEEVITTAYATNIVQPEIQQQLAIYIKKLMVLNPAFKKQTDKGNFNKWDYEGGNKNNDNLSALFILLSHCFEKKGDVVTAGLLYNKANISVNNYDGWGNDTTVNYNTIAYFDRYASPNNIDTLLAFKHKKSKTPFAQLISPVKWGMDDEYKDLKGTILFRQKNFKEALVVFKSIDPNFWLLNYEYKNYLPLTTVTHTGKMIPSETSIPATYNKPSKMLIVKDIVNLLDAISISKTNTEKALLYYKLANAYFNTSFNGKAWMMFSYGKSSQENYASESGNYNWAWFNFYPNNVKYRDYYYRCSDAISMYQKALSLTTNKELAAKCLLSLSTCDIIRHENVVSIATKSWAIDSKPYFPDYLKRLKAQYSTTNAFKEAAVECPDIKRSFVK